MDESVLQPQQGYYPISINRRPGAHTYRPYHIIHPATPWMNKCSSHPKPTKASFGFSFINPCFGSVSLSRTHIHPNKSLNLLLVRIAGEVQWEPSCGRVSHLFSFLRMRHCKTRRPLRNANTFLVWKESHNIFSHTDALELNLDENYTLLHPCSRTQIYFTGPTTYF